MKLLNAIHNLGAKIGLSPRITDQIAAAVAYVAYNLIVVGNLDLSGLRLAVGAALLAVVGIGAPGTAAGGYEVKQRDLEAHAKTLAKRRHR